MIPSRLEKTNEQYVIKALSVCSRAAQSYGIDSPHSVPPLTVIEHLIARKPSIARNTWKQYKNALRHHFTLLLAASTEKVLQEELQAALTLLDTVTSEGTLRFGTQTSSLKQKGFKRPDFIRLLAYLDQNEGKHRYARPLKTWLKATYLVGLRPGEWHSAGVTEIQGRLVLIVENAKATNGRGNGEHRSLDLGDLTPDEMSDIHEMIAMLEGYAGEIDFDVLQTRIGDYMKYATRHCFGKRAKYPTLYSMRHQFSANAKLAGNSKAEVAALMGHGSDETAGEHYARKVSGDSAGKVKPLLSDVKNVRAKAKQFKPKSKLSRGRGD
ncbi:site-specific integrase [Pseudomonas sp. WS 5532]|uniref:site-specific integrase n=1 Tax=Pseudomonas sp. WS 5532 TaxID=2717495 RepID=UPI001472EE82|nr:site-specific integrase [Pseudomonas sp. WS 5532]NMX77621.1 site-specific integrase [Pseudomonas sp. WS 5532]